MPTSYTINPKGQFEIVLVGDIDFEKGNNTIEKMFEEMSDLTEDGKPVYVLVDMSKTGKISREILEFGTKFLRDVKLTKFAVYGANPTLTTIINTMSRVSGKGDLVKVFKDRETAAKWLEA